MYCREYSGCNVEVINKQVIFSALYYHNFLYKWADVFLFMIILKQGDDGGNGIRGASGQKGYKVLI